MTTNETISFIELVRQMRELQKKCFSRMSYDIERVKKLEKRVDEFLSKHFIADKQKTLF